MWERRESPSVSLSGQEESGRKRERAPEQGFASVSRADRSERRLSVSRHSNPRVRARRRRSLAVDRCSARRHLGQALGSERESRGHARCRPAAASATETARARAGWESRGVDRSIFIPRQRRHSSRRGAREQPVVGPREQREPPRDARERERERARERASEKEGKGRGSARACERSLLPPSVVQSLAGAFGEAIAKGERESLRPRTTPTTEESPSPPEPPSEPPRWTRRSSTTCRPRSSRNGRASGSSSTTGRPARSWAAPAPAGVSPVFPPDPPRSRIDSSIPRFGPPPFRAARSIASPAARRSMPIALSPGRPSSIAPDCPSPSRNLLFPRFLARINNSAAAAATASARNYVF